VPGLRQFVAKFKVTPEPNVEFDPDLSFMVSPNPPCIPSLSYLPFQLTTDGNPFKITSEPNPEPPRSSRKP
jgi:hypothetical protein